MKKQLIESDKAFASYRSEGGLPSKAYQKKPQKLIIKKKLRKMELNKEISKIRKGIREIQIKASLRLNLILVGIAITKKTNAGEDVWENL